MECHAAAEIAIAQMKPVPQCDQLDNKYYLPNQCGLDGKGTVANNNCLLNSFKMTTLGNMVN